MKNYLLLFVVSAAVTFSTLVLVSHIRAVPCDCGAMVCDFTISHGILYDTNCVHGISSTSMQAIESTVKDYVETDLPCGVTWYIYIAWSSFGGDPCGSTAWADCE